MSKREAIGWIGTGVMGTSMIKRLLAADFPVTVTTRTPERAREVRDAGAEWVATPADLVARCQCIISMVGYPHDVEEVYRGANGVLTAIESGQPSTVTTLVDMTTSSPSLARELAEQAQALGLESLDAPVSGGDVGAREGTLSIMVGGEPAAFAAMAPIFDVLGKQAVLQGTAGSGQHTKMVNQIFIASTMLGVCEGILYAERSGLDPQTVLSSVASGAAGSWTVDNLAPRILAGNYDPGFFVEHFIKDMGIALAEAERLGIALPGLAQAKQLYVALRAQGHGRAGTQALILALRKLCSESE